MTVEGDWKPDRMVVIEFPGRDKAEAFLVDPQIQGAPLDDDKQTGACRTRPPTSSVIAVRSGSTSSR
jgi:uncharacterized protein (DUF1330 family)